MGRMSMKLFHLLSPSCLPFHHPRNGLFTILLHHTQSCGDIFLRYRLILELFEVLFHLLRETTRTDVHT